MKIMFVHATMNAGGAERTIASLSNFFVNKNHEVSIVTLRDSEVAYLLSSKVKYYNCNRSYESKNAYEAVKNNIFHIKRVRSFILKEKPDIILCFSVTSLFITIVANISQNSKIIYSERSNPYVIMKGTMWKKLKRPLSIFADGCIFQTERAKSYYPKLIHKKSIIIQNPVFVNDYTDLPTKFNRKKTIVSVGRLINSKGFDVLIKAFSMIHHDYPEYKLLIYGDGEELESLQRLIKKLSLENKVELPGHMKNIPTNIFDAAVFVFPSRLEGMPNALLEAMACGLPCVSTDCDMGPRELINNYENGILVPVDEENEMEKAIREILNDTQLAIRLGNNAKKVQVKNSIEVIGDHILEYMERIIYGNNKKNNKKVSVYKS
ncbi:glycosyltransferase family 4 protein [Peribacillus sp. NPDC096379]|uniref:glycosyltransferase family 4 protein n=1 Tax=Peribacillus sp. NPDC096379 TaxID=3364393 RepID=UPI00380423E3